MKPSLIIIVAFVCLCSAAKAQQSDTTANSRVFTTVQVDPSFPGGIVKFFSYLKTNLKYPDEAHKNDVQGKVLVTFVVERNGSLTDIRVVKSLSAETDAEALRLMKDCPKWNPGTQNGNPVRVQYTLPIPFPIN